MNSSKTYFTAVSQLYLPYSKDWSEILMASRNIIILSIWFQYWNRTCIIKHVGS